MIKTSPEHYIIRADKILTLSSTKTWTSYEEAVKNESLREREASILSPLFDAYVEIKNGRIIAIDSYENLPAAAKELLHLSCKTLMPSWIECHSHAVFAGSRHREFILKNAGKSYAQIAKDGGGIISTVNATRKASNEELLQLLMKRLSAWVKQGIFTMEIKSGYGLSTREELRLLEIIKIAKSELQNKFRAPIEVKATFLGAHSLAPEFKSMEEYADYIVEEMLDAVAEQGIAEACDVFCETGAFNLEETTKIWEKALRLNLKIKAHAEQFTNSGATRRCASLGGLSADHLDELSPSDIEEIKNTALVPVVFPSVAVFMQTPKLPPLRQIIQARMPFAISTNFNPGTCPSNDLGLAASLACTLLKTTPAEALFGITKGAAMALGIKDEGEIRIGNKANLLALDQSDFEEIFYGFGKKSAKYHICGGRFLNITD